MRSLPALFLLGSVLLVAGCGDSEDDSTSDASLMALQQAQAASGGATALNLVMEASSEALYDQATAGDSSRGTGGDGLDFTRALTTLTVDLGTFTVNGVRVVPNASGSISISASGAVASSWPAGTTQLVEAEVTVSLNEVTVRNAAGETLRIASGTYQYHLSATGTWVSEGNWSITGDALLDLPVASALSATLDRGGVTNRLTLSGRRRVHTELTRTTADGVNRRTGSRTVSGDAALAQDPGTAYTSWVVGWNGIPVTWNRSASISWTIDYLSPATPFAVSERSDKVYISTTAFGVPVTLGPYTAYQAATLMGLNLADALVFRQGL